jgi:hypothetical protein
MKQIDISWPGAATLMWDGDEVLDITSGQRGNFPGALTAQLHSMTYRFDRAIGIRSRGVHWAVAYTNRATKALLFKDGKIHRELNRSFYCAEDYDYPIAIGDAGSSVVVAHCPNSFDLLEIEDAETGAVLDSLKSKDMEFHSRLTFSPNGRLLIDAGWFWHPWCGAAIFEIAQSEDRSIRFAKNAIFSAQNEIDGVAFLGDSHLIVSSVSDYFGEDVQPESLRPKQLGIWSLTDRRWESRIDLSTPTGMLMPWKEWVVSFYDHPKLIELATGKIAHTWDNIYSGKQIGPIELGNPLPPLIALDPNKGSFAVANSKTVTLVSL